jgi:hypothetical protein
MVAGRQVGVQSVGELDHLEPQRTGTENAYGQSHEGLDGDAGWGDVEGSSGIHD